MQQQILFGLCFALASGIVAYADDPPPLNVSFPAITNDTNAAGHQSPESAPPLPILAISDLYLLGQSINATVANQTLGNGTYQSFSRRQDPTVGPIQCGPGNPCLDKSCCNSDNKCGYGPEHCSISAPASCISNCDATAMCGRDSKGGNLKCGENLCCSHFGWCGTTERHCNNSDTKGWTQPCQQGFGGCQVVPSPVCDAGQNTAAARKIGYYNANNVNTRSCNRVSPSKIKTEGFTHLNFAFAAINPDSFQVVPMFEGDEKLYLEFTALQKPGLETWLAVGGFDFSNLGPTHNTWSQMCSSSNTRSIFINSLVTFLERYHFQGVDLDWEYPSADERGGQPDDIVNQVALVKELRLALGSKYGLSVVLAPDYWYLRGSDPKGMEQYVNWFGFMSYDLHGFWDANTPTLGNVIRPHTDIRDIQTDTLPLWFDFLNPAKINFGMAYYGRGFTVSDKSCMFPGCKFAGPSLPAPCTNFAGVMSLREINQLIAKKKLVPELLRDPMIKQITWDDQWIGYDDNVTMAMKMDVANSLCFGGTMVWSVDFDSEGSGDDQGLDGDGSGGNAVYLDPSIWSQPNPVIQCIPPCTMVLPPWPLSSTSTIVWPDLTTFLMSSSAGSTYTKTTVITVPPFTITEIPFWPVAVTSGDTAASNVPIVQSIMPPSIVLTIPGTEATFPPSPILPPATSTTPVQPTVTPSLVVSPDSTCGTSGNSYTCLGSGFGDCCSSHGHCGSGSAFCGGGCDPQFGKCDTPISNDGTCGVNHGNQICLGSQFGDCCSTSGNCGSSNDHCITSCDPKFGKCSGVTSSSSSNLPVVIFPTTTYPVTIQPHPTHSITLPPFIAPTVSFTSAPPISTCKSRCGRLTCGIFGCPPAGCGLFGCSGGCGIFGCGGFPGINGVNPTCPRLARIFGLCGPGPGGNGGSGGGGGSVGNPDDPDNPNNPDDPNCEPTQTATNCFEYWGPTTLVNSATTTTVTSSTCFTNPVCTGSKTTSTITTTGSVYSCPLKTSSPVYVPDEPAWDGCYACDSPSWNYGVYYDDGNDSEDHIARRSEHWGPDYLPSYAPLRKRAPAKAVTKLLSCDLPTSVNIPAYTGGYQWYLSESQNNIQGTQTEMPRWLKSTMQACLPTYTPIPRDRLESEATNGNADPSLDHAWEKSWMQSFFENVLNQIGGSDNCNQLNQIFFPPGENCLELIYQAIPGEEFWDFVGMDKSANNAKGSIKDTSQLTGSLKNMNKQWNFGTKNNNYQRRHKGFAIGMNSYNTGVVGCQLWSNQDVFNVFDRTNSRIYGRLLDIDTSANTRGLVQVGWADKYKTFMENELLRMASEADQAVGQLLAWLSTRYNDVKPQDSDVQPGQTLAQLLNDWNAWGNQLNAGTTTYQIGQPNSLCKFQLRLNWNYVPYDPAQQCGNGGGILAPGGGGPSGGGGGSGGGFPPRGSASITTNTPTGTGGGYPPRGGNGGTSTPTSLIRSTTTFNPLTSTSTSSPVTSTSTANRP